MVTTFASAEKDLGVKTAEEIRNRVAHDVDQRKLVVITKNDINKTLEASGYPPNEALAPSDAKALASLLRADEYIEGVATRTPTGVKVEARLVLSRDQNIGQPLPAAEAADPGKAAQAVSKSYQAAREQLAAEKNCYTLFRAGKFAEAAVMARSGLAKYPNGTIAMVCLANAYQEQKLTDSVLAVSERITAIDPRNIPALRYEAEIYQAQKNNDKAIETLTRLMAADPSNDRLREQVIASIVQSGHAERAVPIVEEALRQNPGDPKTLNMAWRVYFAANQFDKMLATGTEMIRADTTLADSVYFYRSATAAATANPAQIATIVQQGITKFPNSAGLLVIQANAQSKAGQNAQALATINRALAANPRIENGFTQKALILTALNQPDSLMATLNSGAAAGADKATLAQIALKTADDLRKAGTEAKNRATLQQAQQFAMLSDQLDPSASAKFITGVSAYLVGQNAVYEAQDTKSCTVARLAKDSFTAAQDNVPAGLKDYPDQAKQILTAIPQFTPAVDDQIRRFCK
jgi:tetratricopeptide (TPR) repeat protein